MTAKIVQGTIPFKGYNTWYRRVGACEKGKLPLLILHGGPGMTHSYLKSLDDLAEHGREVIYYDQIGCGNSPCPEGDDFYTVSLFVQEIDAVRAALGLKEIHILGQSWGGMLLMDYMLTKPQGIKSIVVSSSPSDVPLFVQELARLKDWLPVEMKNAISKGLAERKFDDPAFTAATNEFYRRHVVNLDPLPDYVAYTFEHQSRVYEIMQGHCEFEVVGKLKDWNITDRLREITTPTLLVSGVSDEVTPLLIKNELDRIPHSEWQLLQGTHLVHAEQREQYNALVEEFLRRKEA